MITGVSIYKTKSVHERYTAILDLLRDYNTVWSTNVIYLKVH